MFRQGVRRILKTPPAETTSAILKSPLRQLHIVLSLTDSFIKDPVIIQVNIKHTVQHFYQVKFRCILGAKTKQGHPSMEGVGGYLEFGLQKQ